VRSIVVGVDGSEGSIRALRFALEEARLRGATVRAVSVWRIPLAAFSGGLAPAIPEVDAFEQAAHARLDAAFEAVADALHGVEVERVVEEGQPADVLVERAGPDDLLVVGSRGLGGFRGLLLGSVGHQCANHARCPVVIVPHREDD
jgi:nucleotide-binding universal stress UspA family protein